MFQEHIIKGVDFLASQQQKDGSFISLSSVNPEDFTNARIFHSTFSTALILSCLNGLKETPALTQIKKKAVSYLLSQKSEHWSFNYWDRESKEVKTMPYPDDLDDTFCALAALYQYNAKIFDGAAFAKIIALLTATEVQEGGPYRTWLVPGNADANWKDVDLVVNSNIAYFLSLQEIELPNLNVFIESAIRSQQIASPYYFTETAIIYFISRFYKGELTNKLIATLLSKKKESTWGSSLENALAINALLNLKTSPKKLTQSVKALAKQQTQGAWPSSGFYIDPMMQGKKHYAGSAALTTAFCLLALEKYCVVSEQKLYLKKTEVLPAIYSVVVENVSQRFSLFDENLRKQSEKIINKTLQGDNGKQIALLPYHVRSSLGKTGKLIPEELLIKLGTASLLGWVAYTIYDDFLDDEGNPKTLPIANLALRELSSIFTGVLDNKTGFATFFHTIMDDLEQANSWEVTNCRVPIVSNVLPLQTLHIPDYGTYDWLAKRSLGHALAPCAILFSLGYNQNSPEVKSLLSFFKHYIIARQLNDDAHDFEKDLKKGHINAVGAVLIADIRTRYKKKTVDLSTLLPMINELFWNDIVVEICRDISKHTSLAREALSGNTLIYESGIYEKMLLSVEIPAQKALQERENVMKFLQAYE